MSDQESPSTGPGKGPSTDHLELGKLLSELKIPGVDMHALVASQQKNLSALADANRQVLAGAQEIVRKQADHIRQAVTEAAQAAKSAATSPAAKDFATHQVEMTKHALDKAVGHLQEVAEIAAKAHAQAADTVNKRVAEGLEELRALLQKK